jgi:hypothetical protein
MYGALITMKQVGSLVCIRSNTADLNRSSNIVRRKKFSRLRWAEYVARIGRTRDSQRIIRSEVFTAVNFKIKIPGLIGHVV